MTNEKKYVNLGIKIRGYLGHDNYLWNVKCPSCNRMYSHFITNTCKHCNIPLQWLTTTNGNKTMAISEGTIYPLLTDSEKERYERHRATVNGFKPTFRFKMFSFGIDATSPAPLPDNHENMKKGALVEILIINHFPVIIPFKTKTGDTAVEVSLPIFKEYGDTVKIISAPRQVAEIGTEPATTQSPNQTTTDIQQTIQQLQQLMAAIVGQNVQPTQAYQPTTQPVNPFESTPETMAGGKIPTHDMINTALNDDEDDLPPF